MSNNIRHRINPLLDRVPQTITIVRKGSWFHRYTFPFSSGLDELHSLEEYIKFDPPDDILLNWGNRAEADSISVKAEFHTWGHYLKNSIDQPIVTVLVTKGQDLANLGGLFSADESPTVFSMIAVAQCPDDPDLFWATFTRDPDKYLGEAATLPTSFSEMLPTLPDDITPEAQPPQNLNVHVPFNTKMTLTLPTGDKVDIVLNYQSPNATTELVITLPSLRPVECLGSGGEPAKHYRSRNIRKTEVLKTKFRIS